MLDDKGFDTWAWDYDESVRRSENNDEYPFAGYGKVLGFIYNKMRGSDKAHYEIDRHRERESGNGKSVLDIGFGTGLLTSRLYENGYAVTGMDFSEAMINIAAEKMPEARLMQWDFSKGMPKKLEDSRFDFIVSTYALHHLRDSEKIDFLNSLKSYLKPEGIILIGDVSFETREKLEACKEKNAPDWDEDEYYFVYNEIKGSLEFKSKAYIPFSHCGGVLVLSQTG